MFKNLFSSKKPQQNNQSLNDRISGEEAVELAKKVIEEVVAPKLEKDMEVINKKLKKHGFHVGIKIDWYFQKLD